MAVDQIFLWQSPYATQALYCGKLSNNLSFTKIGNGKNPFIRRIHDHAAAFRFDVNAEFVL